MRPPFARTFFDLLLEQAERAPHHPAVVARGETVSYAELAARAARLAARLRAGGVRRGVRVGVLCDNRVEWLEILFAAHALGALVVPFSTWSTRAELEFLLADSRVRWMFVLARVGERDFAGDVAALAHAGHDLAQVVLIDGPSRAGPGAAGAGDARGPSRDGWLAFADCRADPPLEPLPPGEGASAGDPALLLYTSGSSSRPKAVPLDHHPAIENGFNIGERQGLGPADRVFVPVPLFWSYGAVNALPATLSHGATLVLQQRFEPEQALDLIESHACTAIYTLPAITGALLAAKGFAPARTASLRTGVTIGSPQDIRRAANELGATAICNIYGSTETYGNCCVTWHHWPLERRARCQGPPLPGVRVRIVDPHTGAACAAGESGAVEVHGYVTRGYAGHSARHDADVFTADGWFRTGDLAALDADGALVYAGRSSEMIKRSGINVSPAEIEEVLQQHPAVGLAGVTGVPHAVRGESIVAFVVPRRGCAPAADALVAHCREHLSSYKLPDRVEIRDALPLTPTGKLMRRELKSLAAALGEDP